MSAELSQAKRQHLPDEFGDECPICGEPFDAGSSGLIFGDHESTVDTVSWVRLCHGPKPKSGWFELPPELKDETVAFSYVHKDEHIEVEP